MWVRHICWSLAAAGCVASNTDGAPDAGEAVAAFTQAEAKLAGEALAAGIEGAARKYGPVAPEVAAAARAAAVDPSCVTSSGDVSDADGDTIPASATLTFDCSERRLGYTGTLTGTESISDGQPDAVAWAFTANADLRASLTGPFGGSMVVDTDGTIAASQGGAVGPFRLTSTLDVISVITNVRGIRTDVTETLDGTVSYAPDLAWTPGGPVVTGTLAVEGAWNVGVDATSAEATLATPTPLTFTPGCDTLVTAGLVEAAFATGASQASITVRWSGCGQSSVTYDPGAEPLGSI